MEERSTPPTTPPSENEAPRPLPRRTRELVAKLREGQTLNLWLVLRIALPFPLSGAILAGSAILVSASPPRLFELWMRVCAAGGIAVGLCAMVGLLLAKRPEARRLTLWMASAAGLLLLAAYVIATDPFCWRGYKLDGACAWE